MGLRDSGIAKKRLVDLPAAVGLAPRSNSYPPRTSYHVPRTAVIRHSGRGGQGAPEIPDRVRDRSGILPGADTEPAVRSTGADEGGALAHSKLAGSLRSPISALRASSGMTKGGYGCRE